MSGETIYSKAADVIRQRGHYRGWFRGSSGAVCAHGAIHVALGQEAECCEEDCPAIAVCARVTDAGHNGIGSWNDDPRTSTEDVLMVLKELHVEAGGS